MSRRCPPGVICFENITILIIILVLGLLAIFLYFKNSININSNSNRDVIIREKQMYSGNSSGLLTKPAFGYSNNDKDVLLNPYEAPLRNNNHHRIDGGDIRGIPINIATQSVETNYRQIGILTRMNGEEMILPLMGKPLITHRDKWNFYTMSDKNNMIKLPVIVNGRSGTTEYGVDNLYNGEQVYVEGYNDAFKVTVYENSTQKYIPYL